jgi:hypothetical protein
MKYMVYTAYIYIDSNIMLHRPKYAKVSMPKISNNVTLSIGFH